MRRLVALALATFLAAAPVTAVRAQEATLTVEIAVSSSLVGGGLAALDLIMLGRAIAYGRSAHFLWEAVGIGLGLSSIGFASWLLVEANYPEDRSYGYLGVGVGAALVGGAIWSIALPSRGGGYWAVLPMSDGESTGLAVAGRF